MLYPGKQRPCPKALALAGQALFVLLNYQFSVFKQFSNEFSKNPALPLLQF